MDGLAPRNDLNVGELVPTALKSALCASLAFFLLCMAVIPNAHAQSLAGHSVGENQSLLEAQNTRRLTEDLGEYTTVKSSPSVGVELSGRYRKSTGTVVYLELVGDGSRAASADLGSGLGKQPWRISAPSSKALGSCLTRVRQCIRRPMAG